MLGDLCRSGGCVICGDLIWSYWWCLLVAYALVCLVLIWDLAYVVCCFKWGLDV